MIGKSRGPRFELWLRCYFCKFFTVFEGKRD